MGQARVFMPIPALARIRPMLRTGVPPPHVVGLRSEDRLEPRAHGGFRPIAGLALAVDAARQPSGAQVACVASERQAGSARTPAPLLPRISR
jgi:hypothetical protein